MDEPCVIIDNGTGYTKAGFGGNEGPIVPPAIIGKPKNPEACLFEYFVGKHANEKRGVLKLNYPIENGIVKDWDGMEKIWENCFKYELKCEPSEHNNAHRIGV